jgi:hypothetical protein
MTCDLDHQRVALADGWGVDVRDCVVGGGRLDASWCWLHIKLIWAAFSITHAAGLDLCNVMFSLCYCFDTNQHGNTAFTNCSLNQLT